MAAVNLQILDIWRRAMVDSVRRDAPDLSARQMAALLTVYMTKPPHTVRRLAATLGVSKPAVTRALDRLSELGMARRKLDPKDRRSILVQRTVKGSVYLSELAEIIAAAESELAHAQAADARRAGAAPDGKATRANPRAGAGRTAPAKVSAGR